MFGIELMPPFCEPTTLFSLIQSFSTLLSLISYTGQFIFVGGGSCVHHGMFSSIPGSYLPDGGSIRPQVVTTKFQDIAKMYPQGQIALS